MNLIWCIIKKLLKKVHNFQWIRIVSFFENEKDRSWRKCPSNELIVADYPNIFLRIWSQFRSSLSSKISNHFSFSWGFVQFQEKNLGVFFRNFQTHFDLFSFRIYFSTIDLNKLDIPTAVCGNRHKTLQGIFIWLLSIFYLSSAMFKKEVYLTNHATEDVYGMLMTNLQGFNLQCL